MKKRQALKHRSFQQDERLLYGFDLEYDRHNGTLIEGAIGNEEEQWFFNDLTAMIEKMHEIVAEKQDVLFLAHWGDAAEFPHLIKHIRQSELKTIYSLEPIQSGERMVFLRLIRGDDKIEITDTAALMPSSLENLLKSYAPELVDNKKGGPDFNKENYNPALHREYLRNDVIGIVRIYEKFRDLLWEIFEVPPAISAGGTALRAWQSTIPDGHRYFRVHPTVEEFFRSGYYGAYVSPGYDSFIHENVMSYDFTAAYGKRMMKAFPVGTPIYTTDFKPNFQGMWRCYVRCIDAPFPMVPYRVEPQGVFWLGVHGDSCWTTLITEEVTYYRKHGYKVDILYGFFFEKSEYIFKNFIEMCQGLEQKGGVYKDVAKIMRNSLYGRFGTKSEHWSVVVCDEPEAGDMVVDDSNGVPIEHIYKRREQLTANYVMPHLAAHITAFQRMALFDVMLEVGYEHILGCDTDSVKVETQHMPEHLVATDSIKKYGELRGEWNKPAELYRSITTKGYIRVTDEKWNIKYKGAKGAEKLGNEKLREIMLRATEQDIISNFRSITRGVRMLLTDGTAPFQRDMHRTINEMHSIKWYKDEQGFFHVCPNPGQGDEDDFMS